jgi:hypothetical protein
MPFKPYMGGFLGLFFFFLFRTGTLFRWPKHRISTQETYSSRTITKEEAKL